MSLKERLQFIYNDEQKVNDFIELLDVKLEKYPKKESDRAKLSQKDVVLITYGDSIVGEDQGNILTLKKILNSYVGNSISAVHILPMFQYSSDDGFSVIDYKEIDSAVGTWDDIKQLSGDYDLMFDAVINHVSKKSHWFKRCLDQDDKYKDYFIEKEDEFDYTKVVRPRTSPLFTPFETSVGVKEYWSTFSDDQIDINYENVEAATDIIELLVYYAGKGAKYIRLDAIGFLWKENGTTCLHHDKTHEMIKLMRDVLNVYAPDTMLITETNVPHKDNISYFGNGYDEAQLVYQFPLPPLTMFSFITKDATKLSEWADSLEELTDSTTYFNFLASHDGVGLRPTEGILTDEERQMMADFVLSNGGRINYKTDSCAIQSPYELNINYQDALTSHYETDDVRIKRFIASQVILMSVVGIPAIYIHSLLGSRNYYYGVETSGINRRINREKLDFCVLEKELGNDSFRKSILTELLKVLDIRKDESAFSPNATQEVLFLDSRIFAIKRYNRVTQEVVYAMINVSDDNIVVDTNISGTNLMNEEKVGGQISFNALEYKWIKA